MECLLPAEAGIFPKVAEEEVGSKVNIHSKTWDSCLDLTLDHPRASHEGIKI